MSIPTPTRTFDFQCQSCGVKVTLHPQSQISVERLFAYLMIPAIFPSLIFFARARRKARAWTDNPVVGGAHHNPSMPRQRMCGCGGAAACVRIGQRRIQGIPVGTRSHYSCTACTRTFTVSDVAGIVFLILASSVLSAVGALIIVFPPGSAVGAAQSNWWFGVGLAVLAALAWLTVAYSIRARVSHPEVG